MSPSIDLRRLSDIRLSRFRNPVLRPRQKPTAKVLETVRKSHPETSTMLYPLNCVSKVRGDADDTYLKIYLHWRPIALPTPSK